MDVSGSQMLIGLAIGILALILMILKTKIHVFLALIIACNSSIVGGLNPSDTITAITSGFGGTLGKDRYHHRIRCNDGKMLELSGAAEKWLGPS